eukprot:IDg19398t1
MPRASVSAAMPLSLTPGSSDASRATSCLQCDPMACSPPSPSAVQPRIRSSRRDLSCESVDASMSSVTPVWDTSSVISALPTCAPTVDSAPPHATARTQPRKTSRRICVPTRTASEETQRAVILFVCHSSNDCSWDSKSRRIRRHVSPTASPAKYECSTTRRCPPRYMGSITWCTTSDNTSSGSAISF